jgi:hypothetical protein
MMSGLSKRDGQPQFDGSDTLMRHNMFRREFALMPGLSTSVDGVSPRLSTRLSTGGYERGPTE